MTAFLKLSLLVSFLTVGLSYTRYIQQWSIVMNKLLKIFFPHKQNSANDIQLLRGTTLLAKEGTLLASMHGIRWEVFDTSIPVIVKTVMRL